METVGRAIPSFRVGTDYILNLVFRFPSVLCEIYSYSFSSSISHPSTTLC